MDGPEPGDPRWLLSPLDLTVLTFMYDHQLEGKSPSWVYFVFSVAVIMYQTLDAMDGKQARRTNSSSPLGQLFDHGCDAMSAVCMCIAACSALGLGATFTTASFLRLRSFSLYGSVGGALHSRFTYSSRKFRRYRGSVHAVCHFFSDGNMGFCTVANFRHCVWIYNPNCNCHSPLHVGSGRALLC